jgi:hypothetical protein
MLLSPQKQRCSERGFDAICDAKSERSSGVFFAQRVLAIVRAA